MAQTYVVAVISSVGILLILLTIFICRFLINRKDQHVDPRKLNTRTLSDHNRPRTNYRPCSIKPGLFHWSDYPDLLNQSIEYGWAAFSFLPQLTPPSTRSNILGAICTSGDASENDPSVDIKWEVYPGSSDFMQLVTVTCQSKTTHTPSDGYIAGAVIRTDLPLPGPAFGFPQEAYFEITILRAGDGGFTKSSFREEGDKLIRDESRSNAPSGLDCEAKLVLLSLGLTGCRSAALRIPGSYATSIGFNSSGSVYLDGVKLVLESEKGDWCDTNRVIGCGFNPSQKKVFFTVDSELVRVISCKSDEFGGPLFPTIASNMDVSIVINLGQCPFMYEPANARRTANPCFVTQRSNSSNADVRFEDSRELFSMGRIDSHWHQRFATSNTHNHGNICSDKDPDPFDISLDMKL